MIEKRLDSRSLETVKSRTSEVLGICGEAGSEGKMPGKPQNCRQAKWMAAVISNDPVKHFSLKFVLSGGN